MCTGKSKFWFVVIFRFIPKTKALKLTGLHINKLHITGLHITGLLQDYRTNYRTTY